MFTKYLNAFSMNKYIRNIIKMYNLYILLLIIENYYYEEDLYYIK